MTRNLNLMWMVLAVLAGDIPCEARPPNIVIILADDLGYGDLQCFGSRVHRTPHIDRLALSGVRCTDFYVTSPVCTPSRIAMLTGKHPARFKEFGVLWPPSGGGLPAEETTLAEFLSDSGYATGLAGKWHLGHSDESLLPRAQGFDSWYGMPYPNDMGPFHPQAKRIKGRWPPMPMYRNNKLVEAPVDPNLLTQQYHAEAIRFIAEHHHRPFFLVVSHAMPHTLLGASKDFRGRSENGLYGDAVEELDWSVGELVRAIRSFNLTEETIIVFTSDNGAALPRKPPSNDPRWRHAGSNGELRGGKGYTFEGGVRVPGIVCWPGRIDGNRVLEEPISIVDLPATLTELAELPNMSSALDSRSFVPWLIKSDKSRRREPVFFGTGDVRAIRLGKWKFLLTSEPAWKSNYRTEPMLFDLELDPSETTNVISQHPKIANDLRLRIERFQKQIDQRMH